MDMESKSMVWYEYEDVVEDTGREINNAAGKIIRFIWLQKERDRPR